MLATFASSNAGRLYGRSCERYGIDPAADIEDDVLAANLRLALMLTDVPDEAEEAPRDAVRSADQARAAWEGIGG